MSDIRIMPVPVVCNVPVPVIFIVVVPVVATFEPKTEVCAIKIFPFNIPAVP